MSQSHLWPPLSSSCLRLQRRGGSQDTARQVPEFHLSSLCCCLLLCLSLFWSYFQGFVDLCQDDKWVSVPKLSCNWCSIFNWCEIFHCVYLWMEVMVCVPATLPFLWVFIDLFDVYQNNKLFRHNQCGNWISCSRKLNGLSWAWSNFS